MSKNNNSSGRDKITRRSNGKRVTGLKGLPIRDVAESKANALAHWNKLKAGKAKLWTLNPIFGEHGIVYAVGRRSVADTMVSTFIMLLPASEREAAAEFFRKRGIQFKIEGLVEPSRARRKKRPPKTSQAACRLIFTNLAKKNYDLRGLVKMDLAGEPCIGVTVGDNVELAPIHAFVEQLTPKQKAKARDVFEKYI